MTRRLPSDPMRVMFYLPRIDDDDLLYFLRAVEYMRPRSEEFLGWVSSVIQHEMRRRMKCWDDEPRVEAQIPEINVDQISAECLAEAITISNELCYANWPLEVAKFWDALSFAVTQVAALRLIEQADQLRGKPAEGE